VSVKGCVYKGVCVDEYSLGPACTIPAGDDERCLASR